jgi:hypothetical protein
VTAYTLFSQGTAGSLVSDATIYTLGMQFSLSQNAPLTGIWWYSASGAVNLPTACAIYAVSGASQVSGTVNNSPSWSGAAGSGWVKCTYNGAVTLSASTNYKVCVFNGSGAGNWYSATSHYWDSGTGSGGLTNGPITAPNNAGGDDGQDTFTNDEILDYPDTSFNAANYWVDVEVTTGTSASVSLTAPNLALAAPLPSVAVSDTVSLTTPNLALAAPLVTPKASPTVSLTAPNLALAAPLVSVDAGATVSLTTPTIALAAPLLTPEAGPVISLTTPNLALATPLLTPEASPAVSLTTPSVALATPLVTPTAGEAVSLTTPNIALAAPLLTPEASPVISLTTPNTVLAAPLVTPELTSVTVSLNTPNLALAAPALTVEGGASYAVSWLAGVPGTAWLSGTPNIAWLAGVPLTIPSGGSSGG